MPRIHSRVLLLTSACAVAAIGFAMPAGASSSAVSGASSPCRAVLSYVGELTAHDDAAETVRLDIGDGRRAVERCAVTSVDRVEEYDPDETFVVRWHVAVHRFADQGDAEAWLAHLVSVGRSMDDVGALRQVGSEDALLLIDDDADDALGESIGRRRLAVAFVRGTSAAIVSAEWTAEMSERYLASDEAFRFTSLRYDLQRLVEEVDANLLLARPSVSDLGPAGAALDAAPPPSGTFSSDLARILAVGSILLTVASLAYAIRRCRAALPVRVGLDAARLALQIAVLAATAVIFHRVTPLGFAVGAASVGALVGALQGRSTELWRQDDRWYARRSWMAVIVWATGIVVMQAGAIVLRTGIAPIGQAIGIFGVAQGIGLFGARQTRLRVERPTTVAGAVAAMVVAAVVLVGPSSAVDRAGAQEDPCGRLTVPGDRELQRQTGQDTTVVGGTRAEAICVVTTSQAIRAATASGEARTYDVHYQVFAMHLSSRRDADRVYETYQERIDFDVLDEVELGEEGYEAADGIGDPDVYPVFELTFRRSQTVVHLAYWTQDLRDHPGDDIVDRMRDEAWAAATATDRALGGTHTPSPDGSSEDTEPTDPPAPIEDDESTGTDAERGSDVEGSESDDDGSDDDGAVGGADQTGASGATEPVRPGSVDSPARTWATASVGAEDCPAWARTIDAGGWTEGGHRSIDADPDHRYPGLVLEDALRRAIRSECDGAMTPERGGVGSAAGAAGAVLVAVTIGLDARLGGGGRRPGDGDGDGDGPGHDTDPDVGPPDPVASADLRPESDGAPDVPERDPADPSTWPVHDQILLADAADEAIADAIRTGLLPTDVLWADVDAIRDAIGAGTVTAEQLRDLLGIRDLARAAAGSGNAGDALGVAEDDWYLAGAEAIRDVSLTGLKIGTSVVGGQISALVGPATTAVVDTVSNLDLGFDRAALIGLTNGSIDALGGMFGELLEAVDLGTIQRIGAQAFADGFANGVQSFLEQAIRLDGDTSRVDMTAVRDAMIRGAGLSGTVRGAHAADQVADGVASASRPTGDAGPDGPVPARSPATPHETPTVARPARSRPAPPPSSGTPTRPPATRVGGAPDVPTEAPPATRIGGPADLPADGAAPPATVAGAPRSDRDPTSPSGIRDRITSDPTWAPPRPETPPPGPASGASLSDLGGPDGPRTDAELPTTPTAPTARQVVEGTGEPVRGPVGPDATNRWTALGADGTGNVYDANGNLVFRLDPDGVATTPEGTVVTPLRSESGLVGYEGADGRRIAFDDTGRALDLTDRAFDDLPAELRAVEFDPNALAGPRTGRAPGVPDASTSARTWLSRDVRLRWDQAGAGPNGELFDEWGRVAGRIDRDGTMRTLDGRTIASASVRAGRLVDVILDPAH